MFDTNKIHVVRWLSIFTLGVVFYTNCSQYDLQSMEKIESASQSDANLSLFAGQVSQINQETLFSTQGAPANTSNKISDGQVAAVQDCIIDSDLSMVTHYRAGVGFSLGAKDSFLPEDPTVNSRISANNRFPLLYKDNFVPAVDQYLAQRMDTSGMGGELQNVLQQACSQFGVKFKFYQPNGELGTAEQILQTVPSGVDHFQIFHSVHFRNNLITVIIPPYWSPTRSGGYSTLMMGEYNVNGILAGGQAIKILAQVYQQDRIGGIGVLWNGGGTFNSRTASNKPYQDMNDLMAILRIGLNLDPNRVVTLGGSRGGLTSLNLASHPAINQFRVAFAYSIVPPSEFSTIALNYSTTTVPLLLYASDWTTGFVNSWMDSFRHPGLSQPQLAGLTGRQAHLNVLTGSHDLNQQRSSFDLTAPVKVNKLKTNQTAVYLEIGSHDFIVPWADQLKLAEVYRRAGVKIETKINYLAGHWSDPEFIRAKVQTAILQLNAGQVPTLQDKVIHHYRGVPKQSRVELVKSVSTSERPLTLEIPKYVINEISASLIATGTPGKTYEAEFQLGSGTPKVYRLALDQNGIATQEISREQTLNGNHYLKGLYELGVDGKRAFSIQYISTSTEAERPFFIRLRDDVTSLGTEASIRVLRGIQGDNCSRCYFTASGMAPTNYGVIETSKTALAVITDSPVSLSVKQISSTGSTLLNRSLTRGLTLRLDGRANTTLQLTLNGVSASDTCQITNPKGVVSGCEEILGKTASYNPANLEVGNWRLQVKKGYYLHVMTLYVPGVELLLTYKQMEGARTWQTYTFKASTSVSPLPKRNSNLQLRLDQLNPATDTCTITSPSGQISNCDAILGKLATYELKSLAAGTWRLKVLRSGRLFFNIGLILPSRLY